MSNAPAPAPGLVVPPGIVKTLRYLWSIPMVRRAAGWAIDWAIGKVVDLIRKKRTK